MQTYLFDGDLVAASAVEIDGGERGDGVERHVVVLGEHGQTVRADLVRKVAVARYAVGAHQHAVHLAVAHQRGRHAVSDERVGDLLATQLVRGEPPALQQRARLVHVHVDGSSAPVCMPDHAQRRAAAWRGQRARVAIGSGVNVRNIHCHSCCLTNV